MVGGISPEQDRINFSPAFHRRIRDSKVKEGLSKRRIFSRSCTKCCLYDITTMFWEELGENWC